MKFHKYFKTNQKLLFKLERNEASSDRTELMTVYVDSVEHDHLILTLPYGADAVDQYHFHEGLNFEITTESFGLGIRTKGEFLRKEFGGQILRADQWQPGNVPAPDQPAT